ncbi:diguanylate cyclase [Marinobacter sp.]|uniref:sensor domain-containing diguanylate cyclase n=1 Tax=Marinobacter sp. TaxID=50741 RepID=UPI003568BD6C
MVPRTQSLLLRSLFLLAGLLVTALAEAQCPVLDVNDASARQLINNHLCYAITRPGEQAHSASAPEALPEDMKWLPAAGHDLVFSHTDSTYWIKLLVQNRSPQQNLWYLKLNYPLLDEVTFWQKSGVDALSDAAPTLVTGDLLPFYSRGIDYRYFLLPVTLKAKETRTIFVRVHSSGALNVPLSLVTPSELISKSNHLTLVHGLFYGALLILAAFNLLLFVSSGTRYYFHNAFYTASMAMFLFAMGGFGNEYFWPNNSGIANISIPLLLTISALAMALFGWSFLEVPRHTLSERTLRTLAWCAAGLLGLTLVLPYTKSILINTVFTLFVIVVLTIIATIRWRQGYQPAFWYLTAWMVMVIGALIYASAAFGYLGDYQAREVMMQAVVGAQVVLLNYAMVQRWRLLNQKLLDIEHQARTELELKVHERTAQLRNTMRELEHANRKLEALSLNDALTGLYNRRHLDKLMPELCLEAKRTGQPLSIALFDADHFKRINDTWGHNFGDHCLRLIADILRRHVKRPRDVAIRFGGEEFVLLLPDTDIAGATRLCESILAEIRSTVIDAPGDEGVTITLSAGLAEMTHEEDPRNLFRRADEALYHSKSIGRDTLTPA